ncbi:hypothetical protein HDU97_007421 [Phlyctochytrium planicorne]|nr:hypothetical protein HDU97_007421 [Phlyctochytrium planicorne]
MTPSLFQTSCTKRQQLLQQQQQLQHSTSTLARASSAASSSPSASPTSSPSRALTRHAKLSHRIIQPCFPVSIHLASPDDAGDCLDDFLEEAKHEDELEDEPEDQADDSEMELDLFIHHISDTEFEDAAADMDPLSDSAVSSKDLRHMKYDRNVSPTLAPSWPASRVLDTLSPAMGASLVPRWVEGATFLNRDGAAELFDVLPSPPLTFSHSFDVLGMPSIRDNTTVEGLLQSKEELPSVLKTKVYDEPLPLTPDSLASPYTPLLELSQDFLAPTAQQRMKTKPITAASISTTNFIMDDLEEVGNCLVPTKDPLQDDELYRTLSHLLHSLSVALDDVMPPSALYKLVRAVFVCPILIHSYLQKHPKTVDPPNICPTDIMPQPDTGTITQLVKTHQPMLVVKRKPGRPRKPDFLKRVRVDDMNVMAGRGRNLVTCSPSAPSPASGDGTTLASASEVKPAGENSPVVSRSRRLYTENRELTVLRPRSVQVTQDDWVRPGVDLRKRIVVAGTTNRNQVPPLTMTTRSLGRSPQAKAAAAAEESVKSAPSTPGPQSSPQRATAVSSPEEAVVPDPPKRPRGRPRKVHVVEASRSSTPPPLIPESSMLGEAPPSPPSSPPHLMLGRTRRASMLGIVGRAGSRMEPDRRGVEDERDAIVPRRRGRPAAIRKIEVLQADEVVRPTSPKWSPLPPASVDVSAAVEGVPVSTTYKLNDLARMLEAVRTVNDSLGCPVKSCGLRFRRRGLLEMHSKDSHWDGVGDWMIGNGGRRGRKRKLVLESEDEDGVESVSVVVLRSGSVRGKGSVTGGEVMESEGENEGNNHGESWSSPPRFRNLKGVGYGRNGTRMKGFGNAMRVSSSPEVDEVDEVDEEEDDVAMVVEG